MKYNASFSSFVNRLGSPFLKPEAIESPSEEKEFDPLFKPGIGIYQDEDEDLSNSGSIAKDTDFGDDVND